MEITLEKIELVKDRTGASYKMAKEALEKCEGNVVDAIIYIEEAEAEAAAEASTRAGGGGGGETFSIIEKLKEIVRKGNVTKIQFKRHGDVILNVPVTAGAVSTIIFPIPTIIAMTAALAAKCEILIEKDNGEVVDINELSGGKINEFRDKAEDVVREAGEKAGEVFDEAKVKASDAFEDAKIKAGDAFENAKYKAREAMDKRAQANAEGPFEFGEDGMCEFSGTDCKSCEFDCEFKEEGEKEAEKDGEEKTE